MGMRTRRFVAHFPAPFRLTGLDALLPAGAYAVDQDEESGPAADDLPWRRVGLSMHIAVLGSGSCAIRAVPVEACDIATAILEALEPHDPGSDTGRADSRAS
jgi:hypothetical protein